MITDDLNLFCYANQLFFEDPGRLRDDDERFTAAKADVPAGWLREERDWWVGLRPSGVELPAQGWKAHISAWDDPDKVCSVVWDYCVAHRVAFKFLRSHRAWRLANSRTASRSASGKLATIYPVDDKQFEAVVRDLSAQLAGVRGPYVLTDLRHGDGPVYVRYGTFRNQTVPGPDGEPVLALIGPDNEVVPDTRQPVFSLPDWVEVPDILKGDIAAWEAPTAWDLPYEVETALGYSNSGGVYRARHVTTGERVLLREARPFAGVDGEGSDAVARLMRQREVMERLRGARVTPAVLGYHRVWEHHFLVEEYVDGTPLIEEIYRRLPLVHHPEPTAAQKAAYTDWALNVLADVERAVRAAHRRGVRIGDIHPGNVMVRPDGTVLLIDLEYARDLDAPMQPVGARGFMPPAELSGAEADLYQLECLRLFTFLPVDLATDRAPSQVSHVVSAVRRHYPVPQGFGATLTRLHKAASSDDPAAIFAADPPHWPTIRDAIAGGILHSADLQRRDLLFPGHVEQFRYGGHTFAYGAAGVLYALHRAGVAVPPDHVQWLINAALRASNAGAGLFDGLHGTAYALDVLGQREAALEVLQLALAVDAPVRTVGIFDGAAGVALNLLHFFDVTGDTDLLEAADELAFRLATAINEPERADLYTPSRRGLLRGLAGPALLFTEIYRRTGDDAMAALAKQCLYLDAEHGEVLDNGTFQLVEYVPDPGYQRYLIYLDGGSAGWALAAREYLNERPDEDIAAKVSLSMAACRAHFVREPGLVRGRAGLILALSLFGREEEREAIRRHIRELALHVQPYQGHVAFPGVKLLRLSMDLATGSAGVLLALASALGAAESCRLPLPGIGGLREKGGDNSGEGSQAAGNQEGGSA